MTTPTVFIIDDDAAVRDSISLLCETAGLAVECHPSAESFLAAWRPDRPGCVVLDVNMGPLSGPDLHAELNRRGSCLPIIYLTAHGDIPMTVRAMKAGAADFMTKPVDGGMLLDRIEVALSQGCAALERDRTLDEQRRRLMSLSPRETEVMTLALAGHANKEIARQLGISHRTVEIHRSHVLEKTGATSMLELARMVADCGLMPNAGR